MLQCGPARRTFGWDEKNGHLRRAAYVFLGNFARLSAKDKGTPGGGIGLELEFGTFKARTRSRGNGKKFAFEHERLARFGGGHFGNFFQRRLPHNLLDEFRIRGDKEHLFAGHLFASLENEPLIGEEQNPFLAFSPFNRRACTASTKPSPGRRVQRASSSHPIIRKPSATSRTSASRFDENPLNRFCTASAEARMRRSQASISLSTRRRVGSAAFRGLERKG